MIIIYDPAGGTAFGDALAEVMLLSVDQTERAYSTPQHVLVRTSTENVVYAARCLYAEGKLVQTPKFAFGESLQDPDEFGRLSQWPKGFCDFTESWLYRLAKRRMKS
jgi:hypothetical protein